MSFPINYPDNYLAFEGFTQELNHCFWHTQSAFDVHFCQLLHSLHVNFVFVARSLGTIAQGVSCNVLTKLFQNSTSVSSKRDLLQVLKEQPVPLHPSLVFIFNKYTTKKKKTHKISNCCTDFLPSAEIPCSLWSRKGVWLKKCTSPTCSRSCSVRWELRSRCLSRKLCFLNCIVEVGLCRGEREIILRVCEKLIICKLELVE